MSSILLLSVPGQVTKILQYLEANGVRIENLDSLDASISSRAPASTALSSAIWTSAHAARLDANISSTTPLVLKEQKFTADGTWTRPTSMVGSQVFLTGVGGGSAGFGDTSSPYHGGAGMACMSLPVNIPDGVSSHSVTIGSGGSTAGSTGGDTVFGTLLTLRGGASNGKGARHGRDIDATNALQGYRDGFMISGADGGSDCLDAPFIGSGRGGASAFANGGSSSSKDGSLGSGGYGGGSGSSDWGKGGDGFLKVYWYEQI